MRQADLGAYLGKEGYHAAHHCLANATTLKFALYSDIYELEAWEEASIAKPVIMKAR
jgi:hypothetical protein